MTQRPPGSLVVSQLLRVEIAMLARVLATVLGAALPPSMVEVERVRGLGDMLRGRPGQAVGVRVTAGQSTGSTGQSIGQQVLGFRAPEVGVTEAYVSQVVRGVTLSTTPVDVGEWLQRLGDVLDAQARADAATTAALQRFLEERT